MGRDLQDYDTPGEERRLFEDDDDLRAYEVVVNGELQYSIWPQARETPSGWTATGFVGNRVECLAEIDAIWTDMRPLSLRRLMDSGT
jgi:MbtH protein